MAIIKTYVKLGNTLLKQPDSASIKINEKLNDLSTFEAEIYNNSANRTALENINQDLKIYSRACWVSDNLKYSDDAEVSHTIDVYTLKKSITLTVPIKGVIRVKFDLKGNPAVGGFAKIYHNGSPVGIEHASWVLAYSTRTEDISIDVKSGDTLELWLRSGEGAYWTYVKNFRLYYNQLEFVGRIFGEDGIEYVSRRRIKISGYYKAIELSYAFFLRLSTSGTLTPSSIQADDGGVFTNETIDGTNATINDVSIPVTGLNDAFYIGYSKPFNIAKMKYSTAGVYSATVIWEYYNGSTWAALTCLDETKGFTKAAGTRYLIIPNKPSDWAAVAVNGVSAYYVRMRISAFTSATTQPLGDQFWAGDEDIARVQYDNIAANIILGDVLAHANVQYGSSYTTAECPATLISLRGEYESHLKWISEIAAALTWTDSNNDKHEYDWWIDASNGIHIKQRREIFTEASPYDISAKLQVLNRKERHKIGNRVFGLGYGDGLNQLRNIREHLSSQTTYGLRDLLFEDLRILHLATLDESADVLLGKARAPSITYACSLRFEDFLDAGLALGDWLLINQPEWGASSVKVRIRAYDLNPDSVRLEVSNEMESVSTLINTLQRNVDILNKTMQGATNIYQVGPLTDNFENAKPAYLYVYIPTEAKKINKVKLNYKVMQFRADSTLAAGGGAVNTSSATGGHSHILGVYDETRYAAQDRHILAVLAPGYVDIVSDIVQNDAKPYGDPGNHQHTVDTSHTHAANYGVVEANVALPTVTININGTDRFSGLSGDQADLDIARWIVTGWNTIKFTPSSGATPNGLGRIQADCIVQVFIESK